MSNYYRLKDKYVLRGWKELPYAIVDGEAGSTSFIDGAHFKALRWCSGSIDTTLPLISDSDRAIIREYVEQGIVEPCEPGQTISAKQEYKLYPSRCVQNATWSITGRCNFKCRHCYMSAPEGKYGELPHDVIMSFIPQMAACGIQSINLTGGEPLIRDDFLEIVDSLLEHDIRIRQIYSNGALVNEKLLDALDARGIHPEFNMSYDGAGWHDWMRGVPGAEDMVNRAFALCRERGFPTGAEMCIHKLNKHTLRESINHLAGLGVQVLKVSTVLNTGNWKKNEQIENSMTISESYAYYLDYLPHYYEDNMPLFLILGGFFIASPREPEKFRIPEYMCGKDPDACICGGTRNSLYISPDGRVLPCMPMMGTSIEGRMPFIQEKGLAECISNSFWFELVNLRIRDFFAANSECRNCVHSDVCSAGCRADALNFDPDNYMAKSPMLCELVMGGWPDRIIETMKRIKPDAELVTDL